MIGKMNETSVDENDGQLQTNEKWYKFRATTILWYMLFSGLIVSFSYHININIAIVDMVKLRKPLQRTDHDGIHQNYECYNQSDIRNISAEIDQNNLNSTKNIFHWDEHQQNLLFSSFYWIYWASSIPGGFYAQKYGTKLVFGLANLFGCILNFLIPTIAFTNFTLLVILRTVQGAIGGITFPSVNAIIAQWVPPNERSKFLTVFTGNSAGIALFFPIFGYIIVWTSWEWVFYINGFIGIIWFLLFQYFVYDTPQKHPRIDRYEKIHIIKSLGNSVTSRARHLAIPWKAIITSFQVWSCAIGQFGILWGVSILSVQLPTYFKIIHGFSVGTMGIITGVPHILRVFLSFGFGYVADYFLKNNLWSRKYIRKTAVFISVIINGFTFVGLSYVGCDSEAAIIFVILGVITQSAHSAGILSTIVDLSPNFASVIFGLCSVIALMSSFIAPYIVGLLTFENQSTNQWKYVFLISGFVSIASGIPFVLGTDSSIQSWNDPEPKVETKMESQNLNNIKLAPLVHKNSL